MKRLVLIASITLISLTGFSQVNFGLKGAVSMSTLTTDISDYEHEFKTGFQAGVYLRIGDKWHLQPEVYFAGKTGEFSYGLSLDGTSVAVKETVTLSTIDVPVLLGLKVFDPPALNIRLQAGPVASFVLNKNFDITLNGVSEEPGDEYKDAWNNMNWALQFGGGVDVLFLTIDLRYELGLSNLFNQPENAVLNHDKVKNNLFFLSVGFKIL